jgi:hypothetical protein
MSGAQPRRVLLLVGALTCLPALGRPQTATHPWLPAREPRETVRARIAPPGGCERETVVDASFAAWLRELPLRPAGSAVRLFDGRLKSRQDVHAAVLDIDVGRRDLQQCADAVLRLRAEWLFAAGRHEAIRFHFTSGDLAPWARWAAGERPIVRGRHVRWTPSAAADHTYVSFRRYLETLFTFAGTWSLERETRTIAPAELQAGDIFVQGGSPGHAVLVLDTARATADGRRLFLLAQSYMPAQEIHVLRNPIQPALDPWYAADFGAQIVTPEWTFERRNLRRFLD